jgi:hypothetical protein
MSKRSITNSSYISGETQLENVLINNTNGSFRIQSAGSDVFFVDVKTSTVSIIGSLDVNGASLITQISDLENSVNSLENKEFVLENSDAKLNDLNLSGDLYIAGTTTTVNSETISIASSFIELAAGNVSDVIDSGFYSVYSTNSYRGLVFDTSVNKWILFTGGDTQPDTTLTGAYTLANLECGSINGFSLSTLNSSINTNATNISNHNTRLNTLESKTCMDFVFDQNLRTTDDVQFGAFTFLSNDISYISSTGNTYLSFQIIEGVRADILCNDTVLGYLPIRFNGHDISTTQFGYINALNQGLSSTSTPTFGSLNVTNNITVGGTVDGVDIAMLKAASDDYETRIASIEAESCVDYLFNQNLRTTDNVTFATVNGFTITDLDGRLDTIEAKSAMSYLFDQNLRTTDNVTFATVNGFTITDLDGRLDTIEAKSAMSYLFDQNLRTTDNPTFGNLSSNEVKATHLKLRGSGGYTVIQLQNAAEETKWFIDLNHTNNIVSFVENDVEWRMALIPGSGVSINGNLTTSGTINGYTFNQPVTKTSAPIFTTLNLHSDLGEVYFKNAAGADRWLLSHNEIDNQFHVIQQGPSPVAYRLSFYQDGSIIANGNLTTSNSLINNINVGTMRTEVDTLNSRIDQPCRTTDSPSFAGLSVNKYGPMSAAPVINEVAIRSLYDGSGGFAAQYNESKLSFRVTGFGGGPVDAHINHVYDDALAAYTLGLSGGAIKLDANTTVAGNLTTSGTINGYTFNQPVTKTSAPIFTTLNLHSDLGEVYFKNAAGADRWLLSHNETDNQFHVIQQGPSAVAYRMTFYQDGGVYVNGNLTTSNALINNVNVGTMRTEVDTLNARVNQPLNTTSTPTFANVVIGASDPGTLLFRNAASDNKWVLSYEEGNDDKLHIAQLNPNNYRLSFHQDGSVVVNGALTTTNSLTINGEIKHQASAGYATHSFKTDAGTSKWEVTMDQSDSTLKIQESGVGSRMTFSPGGGVHIGKLSVGELAGADIKGYDTESFTYLSLNTGQAHKAYIKLYGNDYIADYDGNWLVICNDIPSAGIAISDGTGDIKLTGGNVTVSGTLVASDVKSGTYVPIFTEGTVPYYVSSSAHSYMRVGNIIYLAGNCTIQYTLYQAYSSASVFIRPGFGDILYCAGTATARRNDSVYKLYQVYVQYYNTNDIQIVIKDSVDMIDNNIIISYTCQIQV